VGVAGADAPVLEEEHLVGEGDRARAVGHDHHGGGHRRLREPVEDLGLHAGVDRGRGVVEHEQAGAADQRPRERDPLPLAAGERGAPLADLRVVAVVAAR
jgi:hypothetical protein